MSDAPQFHVAQNLDITEPAREKAYPIPASDWEYLRRKVSNVPGAELLFHTIGSAVLGVAASAIVTAKTIPEDQMIGKSSATTLAWIIFWAALTVGILAIIFSRRHRKVQQVAVDSVLEEMDRLKKKYGNC